MKYLWHEKGVIKNRQKWEIDGQPPTFKWHMHVYSFTLILSPEACHDSPFRINNGNHHDYGYNTRNGLDFHQVKQGKPLEKTKK